MEPNRDTLLDIYERMVRIRTFEEEAGKLMEAGKIPGALHLYVGEEAVGAGVMVHLSDEDQITSTHRGHGHLVAKGGDLRQMFAELFGRADGYCKGKGGSMHISDLDLGMLGANGIVGAGPPIAIGAGFSNQYRGTDRVTCCFFGDGASNEGTFHEAANMAALYKLPVVFICENNGFGEFTSQERHQAIKDVADRATAYGMPGIVVDGMDAIAVYEAAGEAIARARRGDGPSLVECKTYRFFDHVGVRGMGVVYRTDEEVLEWRKRDPITLLEDRLTEMGILSKADAESIRERTLFEVQGAIEFAEQSPMPKPEALLEDVYTPSTRTIAPPPPPESATRETTYVAAIREALQQCLADDPNVFLAGEDVALYGGVFGTSRGLLDEFGPRRVIDTPIAESGILGLGVGSSATGLRPIIEIMFMDFMGVCMDEILNQAAKMKYMFGGKATLPLTIRTMAGGGMSMAAQHSQSLEAWLAHVPGLKVVMPSNPYDAKGLLVAAIRDDNPVIVVENKLSLGFTGPVPEELYEVPIGKGRIMREGTNFTIVATGRMVSESLKAADQLASDGLDVEVIDPRTIQPLDTAMIVDSVRKTHRALVAHEAVRFAGIGAEIAAQIQEEAFDYLDAPIGRVGAPFSPVPFSPALEKEYIPNAERIASEVRRILGRQV